MRELTKTEVDSVSGAVAPVLVGGLIGGFWNGYNYLASPGATGYGLTVAVGFGVLGGSFAAMGGLGATFYGGGIAFAGGVAANPWTSGGGLLRTGGGEIPK